MRTALDSDPATLAPEDREFADAVRIRADQPDLSAEGWAKLAGR